MNNVLNFRPPGGGDQPPTNPPGGQDGGADGTPPGMNPIWKKLDEHDKRFDRLEDALKRIADQVGQLHLWIAGTAIATFLGMAGLMIALWSYTASVNSTALTAIQTALTARPSEAPAPQPPTVIIVPTPAPQVQAPSPSPAPKP